MQVIEGKVTARDWYAAGSFQEFRDVACERTPTEVGGAMTGCV
jgi:hypothetical protein